MITLKIKEVAKAKGFKMNELSKIVGMSQCNFSLLTTKNREGISFKTLDTLCSTLNVKVQDLIEYKKD